MEVFAFVRGGRRELQRGEQDGITWCHGAPTSGRGHLPKHDATNLVRADGLASGSSERRREGWPERETGKHTGGS